MCQRLFAITLCALTLVSMEVAGRADAAMSRAYVPFSILEDPTGKATIDDVSRDGAHAGFTTPDRAVPNLGLSQSAWWIRVEIEPPADAPALTYYLAASWALIDEATLYVAHGDGAFDVRTSGRFAPARERDVVYRHPVFRITPTPGQIQTYYLRLRGNGTMLLPLELFSPDGFEAKRRNENVVFGAFFGVLALMTVFGALAYAFLREPMFRSYTLMIAGFALWQATSEGLFGAYVWPGSTFLIDRALNLFGLLFGSSAMLFTRTYLETRNRLPALDRVLFPAGPIGALTILVWTLVAPGPPLVIGVVVITVFAAAWAVVVSVVSFRQGYRPANYYILAWFVGCIAAIAQALRAIGWVPSNLFSDFGLQTSVVFTFVTLSLGIVDRMVGMRSDLERNVEDIRRLEREDAAKRTFLATASHDLRQPLHAVGLLLGALRERMADRGSIDLVEKIQSATTEMADMFNALLDISRLDAGLVETRPATVALEPLLRRLGDEFSVQAKMKGLDFVLETNPSSVRSDPILLARILRNLLTNAMRYTDEGELRLTATASRQEVAVTVADSGHGIPAEARERIFQPFRRLSPETDTGEALGLGLAIVHRLANLLEHRVTLESTPGEGTAFTLHLARTADETPESPQNTRPPSTETRAQQRVLVIDDDPTVRTGMRAQLESWGYDVRTASSRDGALLSIAESEPDVVFADHQLGGGQAGIEVVAEIRRRLENEVPALIVSGDTSPEVAEAMRTHGLLLLTKPVQPSRLRMALDYANRQRR